MRKLKVEKLEGIYVICSDSEKKLYAIEQNEAPTGVKPGDVLEIDQEGTITVISSGRK